MDDFAMNEVFFEGLSVALSKTRNRRKCCSMPDDMWIELGVRRVISNEKSGLAFLASLEDKNDMEIAKSLYFEALKNTRRCLLCEEVVDELAKIVDKTAGGIDSFDKFPSLDKYRIYAGDGHYLKHACHDPYIDGKKYATGHFFGINLRSHSMFYLDVTDQTGGKKKEHDMKLLKRMSVEKLLNNSGNKPVIWVWDKAGIDAGQWIEWSKKNIYFVSRAKENMKLKTMGVLPFDENHEINRGIEAFELVSVANRAIRMVRYAHPVTKEIYTYLTTLTDVEPGEIAALYQARWDIEKVFDETKSKCEETKSWATSKIAKRMQALFICMTHNLLLLLERKIQKEHGIENEKEEKRKKERHDEENEKAIELKTKMPKTPQTFWKRITQRCYRFIRWVRNGIDNNKSWKKQLETIRKHMTKGCNFYIM